MSNPSTFSVYNASAGSGKTFTLVKEYLKILLSTEDLYKFQQILAITFTNKAAHEMKERVLGSLRSFANKEKDDLFFMIQEELAIDTEVLQVRSAKILSAILQNYSAFSVTTIDSFTHKIIKSFAYDLGLSQSFEVEMDTDELLREAIDVLIAKIGTDQEITTTLVQYAKGKSEEDKSWDVSRDLLEFSQLLLNEGDLRSLQKIENKTLADFESLSEKLKIQNKAIEKEFRELGEKGISKIEDLGLDFSNFAYKDLPNHFVKLTNYAFLRFGELKFEGRLANALHEEKDLFSKSTPLFAKELITLHRSELVAIYQTSKELFDQKNGVYRLNKLMLKSIIPLATLQYIYKELNVIKEENNIQLNSEFNHLISKNIQNQPAPFIYERIGNKYRHYFIDEMQDTSQVQWENLIPLLHNTLSQEDSSLLLVGDGKQSIYRWRGGKAEQFIDLGNQTSSVNPFSIPKEVETLKTNYRSYQEVVHFNNDFFDFVSQYLSNTDYRELFKSTSRQETVASKEGGYVAIDFVEDDKEDEDNAYRYAKKVFDIIQESSKDFDLSDICIITRKRKEGVLIADYLTENNMPITSSETLLLINSPKVEFLIHLLEYSMQKTDDVKFKILNFLHSYLHRKESQHEFFISCFQHENIFANLSLDFDEAIFSELPLYEKLEYAIDVFHLMDSSDAYVQFFLDEVLRWQQKELGIQEVLEQWELKKDKLSIISPEGANAVQIMTIHKSKGLEFPVVIYVGDVNIYQQINPKIWLQRSFQEFEDFLIPFTKELSELNHHSKVIYERRRNELELDAINLLYVTLTRAKEQLFIVTDNSKSIDKDVNYFSQYFKHYLIEQNKFDDDKIHYEFGKRDRSSKIEKETSNQHHYQQAFLSVSRKEHQIDFLSSSSKLWGTTQKEAIDNGNLIHELLSKVIYADDLTKVLQQEVEKGNLSQNDYKELKDKIQGILNHPKLEAYYQKGNKVFNERVLKDIDGQLMIPDRLVLNGDECVILDYKTGSKNETHKQQLHQYERLLKSMGYSQIKKVLVYISDAILVEEF